MRLKNYLNEEKWGINFAGKDNGEGGEVKGLSIGSDGQMDAGLSIQNNRKNYMVEGATETNKGFLKALKEIVEKYPEIKNYWIKFDSPDGKIIKELINQETFDGKKIKFYHGTSLDSGSKIRKEGLKPRNITGSKPSFGSTYNASKGRENVIYLTTQKSMANFAASDASRVTKSQAVILEIDGKYLNSKYFIPDEDSREKTARLSLDRIGSVGYTKDIPIKAIKRVK